MKLIDRYVTEVGRRLPLVKGRVDIEKELRSTLEDMLEDRAQKAGKPADESMEIELLKEYGAPDQVAATYDPHPYLIGPRMYPFFIKILQIVFFAIAIAFAVTTGIEIVTQAPTLAGREFVRAIGHGLGGIISSVVAAFGNIVLIFAVLERVVPNQEFNMNEEKEWDPASLMKEPEPTEVKPWEAILSIVFIFIALSIFNFNSQLLGIYTFTDGKWISLPLLSDAFFRWLPLMNIAWVAEIILYGLLLRSGKWELPTRLFSIGIKIFQVVIAYLLFIGPSIFAVTTKSLSLSGQMDAEAVKILGNMAQHGSPILMGLIIFVTIIDIIKTVYKLITKR
ncbi:MAG: hypothetical protein U0Z26_15530 [Anaerolineales bacterium]